MTPPPMDDSAPELVWEARKEVDSPLHASVTLSYRFGVLDLKGSGATDEGEPGRTVAAACPSQITQLEATQHFALPPEDSHAG
jgi:hypothetical protein